MLPQELHRLNPGKYDRHKHTYAVYCLSWMYFALAMQNGIWVCCEDLSLLEDIGWNLILNLSAYQKLNDCKDMISTHVQM